MKQSEQQLGLDESRNNSFRAETPCDELQKVN